MQLLNIVFGIGFEFGIGVEFRHKVVVVGVEPFGHFDSELVFVTARQLEELFQRQVLAVEAEAGGNRAGGDLQVEDVVVESEIACGNVIGVSVTWCFQFFSRKSLATASNSCSLISLRQYFSCANFNSRKATNTREA